MMQVVLHQFPAAQVQYRYKCRTPNINLVPYIDEISDELDHFCELYFTEDELSYLSKLRFIKSDFVDFLRLFHVSRKWIDIQPSKEHEGEIDVIVTGPWLHTILFEVPVLAIINEVYFRNIAPDFDMTEGRQRLQSKISLIKRENIEGFVMADYGTRRRFSSEWHREVVQTLAKDAGSYFAGTSNVLFAKEYGLRPLGTMAHEYLQACQALGPRLRDSQVFALEKWAKEYRGDLGIALSDVYGMDAFLRDFDMYFCKLFDGARHDSGDPIQWGERLIAHYIKNRCDPKTKTLIFSDGLTVPKSLEIAHQFQGRCKMSFGIGTNLTNDVGLEPLQVVMKMVRCNGQPVAKISDQPNKTMCDDMEYLDYLRYVFDMKAP